MSSPAAKLSSALAAPSTTPPIPSAGSSSMSWPWSQVEPNLVVVGRHEVLPVEKLHELREPVAEREEVRVGVEDTAEGLSGSPV